MDNNFTLAKANEYEEIFTVIEGEQPNYIRHTTTTEEEYLFNALNGNSEKVKDYIDEVVEITNIVITSANVHEDKNNENSPLESRPCVHFFTTTGKHITSISNGIARATKNLFACGMIPSPERPRKIRFVEVETKMGIAHGFELVK